ncbi:glycosyltransferase family 8 [Purpureocillium lavendulum]|uniref:Glycosyltransferase family 8 n=1 Tax=Purpureocillium lavendulum TaxID=1247861 RepID=A0AB34FDK2_9HYPO|nr:glycosyltransferase family 8 [Purpureocillium lavendulum]
MSFHPSFSHPSLPLTKHRQAHTMAEQQQQQQEEKRPPAVDSDKGSIPTFPLPQMAFTQAGSATGKLVVGLTGVFEQPTTVWTTLITNLEYLPGLLTLAHSLRTAGSAYPLLALYTDSFPAEGLAALAARGIPAQRIPYLLPSTSKDYSNDPRFYDCWSKLAPFSLTEYARVVQLDSDMLVLANMDELMDLELDEPPATAAASTGRRVFAAGHACVCNPLAKPHYPKDWVPQNCAFTSQHGDPDSAQTVAADPSVGPLGFMNGGLQVVNPSAVLYRQIIDHMEADAANMDFADQSLLSDLYRGRWVPLPYIYNALKTLRWPGVHDAIWRDDRVKNLHYILSPKPWDEIDDKGQWTGTDETHKWWIDVNSDRKAAERKQGIPDDGF